MTPITKAVLTAIIMLAICCTKEPLQNRMPNITAQDNEISQIADHYLGEYFGGGIIFYLDSTGQHGLIADTSDLGVFTWRPNNIITITGATKTGLGKGKMNTLKIKKSQGDHNGDYAALECAISIRNGYTDWYLPSKDELNKLYQRRNLIGGFRGIYYWSSSEVIGNAADYAAWMQYFPDGSQDTNYKYNTLSVRAVRLF